MQVHDFESGAALARLRVDGQRLWNSLMQLAQIGATEKGGVCRLALTELDRIARDWFVAWAKEIAAELDEIGCLRLFTEHECTLTDGFVGLLQRLPARPKEAA